MNNDLEYEWDLFICHASEDKNTLVRPLVERLKQKGYTVWYDEDIMTLGDSIRGSIERGLLKSKYGWVIISPYFFNKEWLLMVLL